MCIFSEVDNYISYCKYQRNLGEHTLRAYESDLKGICRTCCFSTGCDISIDVRISILIRNWEIKYKSSTIARKIATLKGYFRYLHSEKETDTVPINAWKIKRKREMQLPRLITKQDVETMLNSTRMEIDNSCSDLRKKLGIRDLAVIELLFATGIRVSELCSIKSREIDLQNGTVIIHGKGRKDRRISISNADVIDALRQYYMKFESEINDNDYFFLNKFGNRLSEQAVRGIIKKYCKIADIEANITPHMFRHSFATYLLEQDVDIRYIQQILGHSSITTTERYTHVAMAKQRAILEKKNPRNFLFTDGNITNDNQ